MGSYSEDKVPGTPRKRQRMDGAGIYLAPLLNLPPRGAYSDAKQVVQQLNLVKARGTNMVIYGTPVVETELSKVKKDDKLGIITQNQLSFPYCCL